MTPGVEATTGPLGQGIANAVGMALAERLLAAEFNKPDLALVNHHTYVFMGDGCMMEGISHEACSLAGTLKLSKLVAFYDDNGISIDGEVDHWFADDTPKRFEAYGWHVIRHVDGHDVSAVSQAISKAKQSERPTLICCKTVIGRGAPTMAGTEKVHGSPLGEAEIAATRKALNWPYPPFEIPKDVYQSWDARAQGAAYEKTWNELFERYQTRFPAEAAEFMRRQNGEMPASWQKSVDKLVGATIEKHETVATRKSSQQAIAAMAQALPEMLGGSADLTGSNLTDWPGAVSVRVGKDVFQPGRYIHYGVREFGMSAILNGIALHRGYIPFGGTFLTFSDYSRNAIRMAALMRLRSLFVFTHDSIGLGEDGPTHQSIEHVASLRLIPFLDVWRPADTTEVAVAWAHALARADGPSVLIFTRQNLPFLEKSAEQVKLISKGAYVLVKVDAPKAVLIATGSEVGLAVNAQRTLAAAGIPVQVVSMPSTSLFDKQDAAYKSSVLPDGIPRVAIESGVTDFWWKYVREGGAVIGIDRFGESAPAPILFEYFGFTVENVVATVQKVLKR